MLSKFVKKNKKGVEGKALIQSAKYINGKTSLAKPISSIQKDYKSAGHHKM